jgi:hypothetical protein
MTLLLMSICTALAAPRASSQLRKDGETFAASRAFDGLLQTSWAESAAGYGGGSWIEFDLPRTTDITSISIWPGDLSQGTRSYRESSRPKMVQVYIDGETAGGPIRLLDEMRRWDLRVEGSGRRVRVEFVEVFEGFVFPDLHIAEVAVNFPDTEAIGRMTTWLGGSEYVRLYEKHQTSVEEAFLAVTESEFGDNDNFDFLLGAAADGADFVASRARSYAPDGYRVQAIPPSAIALKALRKIGDANAIPALEMAAMRSWGEDESILREEVERFYAYQDLVGGADFNIPAWGQEGWEEGAYQGFGEPLPIEVDQFAQIYVVDTGNNRIQRINERGNVDRNWGGYSPTITNTWFTRGRPYYVSGAEPAAKPGRFETPLDIAIIPGKDGDGFATLDATGRVQVFDMEGRVVITWNADSRWLPEPKLGGQGYLAWLDKLDALLVIVQDQAILYNLDSEEISRWEIEDGTPNAVEVDRKGKKLLMAFGDEVVSYTHDGFRDRTLIDAEILGRGFESMDMTLDEQGKLWILTDKGRLFKFKKPGRVEFDLTPFDRPISQPRIAVFDNIVYVTHDNRVQRIDVLQLQIDEKLAAEAAEAAAAPQ